MSVGNTRGMPEDPEETARWEAGKGTADTERPDPLAQLAALASSRATTNRSLGRPRHERDWLDVLALVEQAQQNVAELEAENQRLRDARQIDADLWARQQTDLSDQNDRLRAELDELRTKQERFVAQVRAGAAELEQRGEVVGLLHVQRTRFGLVSMGQIVHPSHRDELLAMVARHNADDPDRYFVAEVREVRQ